MTNHNLSPSSPGEITDEEFKSRLLEIGKQTDIPGNWLETWANTLVKTVPAGTRDKFLKGQLEPTDTALDISPREEDPET